MRGRGRRPKEIQTVVLAFVLKSSSITLLVGCELHNRISLEMLAWQGLMKSKEFLLLKELKAVCHILAAKGRIT